MEAARKNAKTDEERAQLDGLERCLRLRLSDSTCPGADVPWEVGVGRGDGHARDNLSAISSQRTDMLRLRCDLSSGRAICVTNSGLVSKNEMSVAIREVFRKMKFLEPVEEEMVFGSKFCHLVCNALKRQPSEDTWRSHIFAMAKMKLGERRRGVTSRIKDIYIGK